ncbi:MAG: glycerol-3-phosphate 1-O-acyltransferase PlsY [Oscillospiraceae bacterium]|nr:glycerol-3-phosphate 1-O-acyltransferase PlsY [Oscillospiraceae bacterium]
MTWILLAGGAVLVESYLLGSLCFGIIFTRLLAHEDIRTKGSGNAGMTNVLRSVGIKAGALTGVGDFLKGAAALMLGRYIFNSAGLDPQTGAYIATFGAVLGHMYPLYFGFRGGKGVMTTAGIMLVLNPLLLVVCGGVFGIVFALSRIVSLASLAAALSFPVGNFIVCSCTGAERVVSTVLAATIAALVFWKHRDNIRRLKNGTENKLEINRTE